MANPQKIKFRTVADFFDFIPKEEQILAEILKEIIIETLPEVREKLSFNVPYYYNHSRICYIWASSVPWGGIQSGVALGFCRGDLLQDEGGYLEMSSRKQVSQRIFHKPSEIDKVILQSYLWEAWEIDKSLSQKN